MSAGIHVETIALGAHVDSSVTGGRLTFRPASVDRFTNTVNQGVEWEVTLNGRVDPESWADTDPWHLRVRSLTDQWPMYTFMPLAGLIVDDETDESGRTTTKVGGMAD